MLSMVVVYSCSSALDSFSDTQMLAKPCGFGRVFLPEEYRAVHLYDLLRVADCFQVG